MPWFWRKRTRPRVTDHRQLIADLVQSDDRHERAAHAQALEDLLATALDASADSAQVAVWAMERRLQTWMQGYLQQQFGVTNEMVGDAVSGVGTLQGQVLALEGLFHQVGERLTGVELTQAEQGTQLGEHAARLAALEAYRDMLPHDERARLVGLLNEVSARVERLESRDDPPRAS